MQIVNEYAVNYEAWKRWAWESNFKGRKLVVFVIWCLLSAVFIGFSIYYFATVTLTTDKIVDIVIALLLAALCIYRGFFKYRQDAKKMYNYFARTYSQREWKRTYIIDDKGVKITEGNQSVEYDFNSVTKATLKENEIWLAFTNGGRARLYDTAYKTGSREKCIEFLRTKGIIE